MSAEDLDFLASVVAGTWGKKAQAEALAEMSGGDAEIAEALSAACALGGVRALGAALVEFRPDWRKKDRGLGEFLRYAGMDGDRPK